MLIAIALLLCDDLNLNDGIPPVNPNLSLNALDGPASRIYTARMKTADAVKYFGSKGKVAKALGISRQALSMWGENVPALRAWQLWYITDGKLELTDRERPAA